MCCQFQNSEGLARIAIETEYWLAHTQTIDKNPFSIHLNATLWTSEQNLHYALITKSMPMSWIGVNAEGNIACDFFVVIEIFFTAIVWNKQNIRASGTCAKFCIAKKTNSRAMSMRTTARSHYYATRLRFGIDYTISEINSLWYWRLIKVYWETLPWRSWNAPKRLYCVHFGS